MQLLHCSLAYGDNAKGRCAWCGRPVPRGRRRWCSPHCSHEYAINHSWPSARLAKLADAAYACEDEHCSVTEATGKIEVHHLNDRVRGRARYAMGCHNHQRDLMVLCGGHHLNETRWERAKGRPVQLELVS